MARANFRDFVPVSSEESGNTDQYIPVVAGSSRTEMSSDIASSPEQSADPVQAPVLSNHRSKIKGRKKQSTASLRITIPKRRLRKKPEKPKKTPLYTLNEDDYPDDPKFQKQIKQAKNTHKHRQIKTNDLKTMEDVVKARDEEIAKLRDEKAKIELELIEERRKNADLLKMFRTGGKPSAAFAN